MNERERHQVLEAEPKAQAKAAPENAGHPLLNLQRSAGNAAVNRLIQTKLTVGNANDPHEREADRVAAQVMQRIRTGEGDAAVPATSAPALQMKSADPLGGAAVPADIEQRISGSSGSPLDGGTLSRMEGAFGADLSGVRVHTGGEAATLSESLQAKAFTTGNDVFFGKGAYDPGSSGGQELLAHELTHVVQQNGGNASRQIRRFVDVSTFAEKTYESFFTQKSTAQKQIEKWLAQYAAMGVLSTAKKGDKEPPKIQIPDKKLATGIQLLQWMIDGVGLWEQANTLEVTSDVGGVKFHETEKNQNRLKRAAGMEWFSQQAEAELAALKDRAANYTGSSEEVVLDEKGMIKLKEHYAGTLPSSLEKVSALVDASVPNVGDAAELGIDLQFPVAPGAFMGAKLGLSAKRGDDHGVELGVELGVQAGGKVNGCAKLGATLGGYVKVKAGDADAAMKLISYGFYRRLVESNAVPAEVSSYVWGGKADDFGKKKADKWSKEVEKGLLGAEGGLEKPVAPIAPEPLSPEDAKDVKKKKAWDKRKADYDTAKAQYDIKKKAYEDALRANGNMVETGAYGEVSGEVELAGVAKVGGAVKGNIGTRYDARSLDARKGGAGEDNKKSDSWLTQNVTSKMGTDRGAEKSIGRTSIGAAVSGSFSAGPFGGKVGVEFSWMGQGSHGKKKDDYVLEGFTFSIQGSGAVPMDQMAGNGLATFMSGVIPTMASSIRSIVGNADGKANSATKVGSVGEVSESMGTMLSQLSSKKELFVPKYEIEKDTAGVQGTVGLDLGFTYGLDRSGTPDGEVIPKKHSADFELRYVKTVTGTIPDTLKIELKRSSRLIGLGCQTGGSWSAK